MPPRLQLRSASLVSSQAQRPQYVCRQCRHASLASATTPAAPIESSRDAIPAAPIARYPTNQPPSHKRPEFRKSQLHRQYQSLLRSTPLMVVFQHNNLKATEWMAIRRELTAALRKTDAEITAKTGNPSGLADSIKIQTIQTSIFASALKVVEFWDPSLSAPAPTVSSTDPSTSTSTPITDKSHNPASPTHTHGLSRTARQTAHHAHLTHATGHGLEPLLSGPLALLTLPAVSPAHLAAAFSILSPGKDFPAPKRRVNPAFHEPAVQQGLQKLMLLAARVEGRVFDMAGARWVGGIEGGLDGLRARVVQMLQGASVGLVGALEGSAKNLYAAVEGRRGMLEEEGKDGKGEGEAKE